MVRRANTSNPNNLSNIIDKSPWGTLATVFIFGFGLSTGFWQLHFNSKIDNLEHRQEDKLEMIKDSYEQKIEIAVIKARQEEREKGSLSIDENSKLGALLTETMNNIKKKNEK